MTKLLVNMPAITHKEGGAPSVAEWLNENVGEILGGYGITAATEEECPYWKYGKGWYFGWNIQTIDNDIWPIEFENSRDATTFILRWL